MSMDESMNTAGPPFKAGSFVASNKTGNKKRTWKSLKQILASERALPWPDHCVLYSSINAPPSFLPAEKFSDLSGLPAPYTDPQTRLRFANKEEYATLGTLPMDITAGFLALRGPLLLHATITKKGDALLCGVLVIISRHKRPKTIFREHEGRRPMNIYTAYNSYTDDGENSSTKPQKASTKASNVLPLWGNERTMNLNNLILTNIQSSHYFKVNLYELKTYHEVVDEIYYKVQHLEPWEKGSRRTSGQTGMCGGVRGVGAGGIVSTAYCLLYKLFTLKLTRKQLNGLITHCDSPYIRALGFMYIRYLMPPPQLLDWYEPYLEDEEEMDVKAGGGQVMKMGMILRQWLVKLEWFSTLFPRIPVPIQQKIQNVLQARFPIQAVQVANQRQRDDRNRFERRVKHDCQRVPRREGEREREYREKHEKNRVDEVYRMKGGEEKEDVRERERDRRYRERSPHKERERERDRERNREYNRYQHSGKERHKRHH